MAESTNCEFATDRLAPEHKCPAALEDAYAAVQLGCKPPREFGCDPQRSLSERQRRPEFLSAAVCQLTRAPPPTSDRAAPSRRTIGPRCLDGVALQTGRSHARARAECGLASEPVPAPCVLDFDGDLSDGLLRDGAASLCHSGACFHTKMAILTLDGSTCGVVPRTSPVRVP